MKDTHLPELLENAAHLIVELRQHVNIGVETNPIVEQLVAAANRLRAEPVLAHSMKPTEQFVVDMNEAALMLERSALGETDRMSVVNRIRSYAKTSPLNSDWCCGCGRSWSWIDGNTHRVVMERLLELEKQFLPAATAQVFVPTWRQKIGYKLFPRTHCDSPEVPGTADVLCGRYATNLSIMDRIRILVSGRCQLETRTATENIVGKNVGAAAFCVLPPKILE